MLLRQDWQGRAHCGMDDSLNVAVILRYLLKYGATVALNEKLGFGRMRDNGTITPFLIL